jgi:hypothetical protein
MESPKCLPRQVTSSFGPRRPDVRPATARSDVPRAEWRWALNAAREVEAPSSRGRDRRHEFDERHEPWCRANTSALSGRRGTHSASRPREWVGNEVEAVNQCAAMMYEATANGTAEERRQAQPQITASRPKVATNSDNRGNHASGTGVA